MLASLKKAATVLCLVVTATTLMVACAAAQIGPGNPSGGTSVRLATEEGRGSLGPVGLWSRQFALPVAWQAAFGSFIASQYTNSYIARPTDTRSSMVTRRAFVKR